MIFPSVRHARLGPVVAMRDVLAVEQARLLLKGM